MQNLCFIIGNARKCLGTIFPDSSMVERLAVNEDVQGSSPCREAFFLVPRTKLFKDNNCGAFANGSVSHFTVRVSVIPTILSPQKSKPLQSRLPLRF